MSPKQIIVLVVLGLADLCVLALGAAILMFSNPQATQPQAVPVAQATQVTASPTSEASATPTPRPPTPTPTETHWPTWTSRPTNTSFPTMTPTSTPTPTVTPTFTRRPTNTPRPSGTPAQPGSGGGPGAPSNRIGCGTPNGRPTNGKLDAEWSVIAWRTSPNDPSRAIGTIEILASGGGDCYKYNFIGRNYDYEPIDFEMNKCGTMTGELIVTSADGQTWKQPFMITANDPGFGCK
jgi:hypothetical protein